MPDTTTPGDNAWLPGESGQAIPIGLYRNARLLTIHTDHLAPPGK